MYTLVIGTFLLSLLHAVIPNHWLPVLAIGKKEKWSLQEINSVTFLSGLAHAMSTIIIGIVFGCLGIRLGKSIQYFSQFIAPIFLICLGVFFLYQHHRCRHFHLDDSLKPSVSKKKIIASLVIAMFLSPCMEIEAYFLLAGTKGILAVLGVAGMYLLISVTGMVLWVRLAYRGFQRLNWHSLEHYSSMITGGILVVTGIISFFIS